MISSSQVEVPIADAAAMASYLVGARRIWVIGYAPVLDGMHRLEIVPKDALAALFADA